METTCQGTYCVNYVYQFGPLIVSFTTGLSIKAKFCSTTRGPFHQQIFFSSWIIMQLRVLFHSIFNMISLQIFVSIHDTTNLCDHFIRTWIKINDITIGSGVSNLPGSGNEISCRMNACLVPGDCYTIRSWWLAWLPNLYIMRVPKVHWILGMLQCLVGSHNRWELLLFFKATDSLCTVPTVGKSALPSWLCKETVKESRSEWHAG